jgi:hypothetical protein
LPLDLASAELCLLVLRERFHRGERQRGLTGGPCLHSACSPILSDSSQQRQLPAASAPVSTLGRSLTPRPLPHDTSKPRSSSSSGPATRSEPQLVPALSPHSSSIASPSSRLPAAAAAASAPALADSDLSASSRLAPPPPSDACDDGASRARTCAGGARTVSKSVRLCKSHPSIWGYHARAARRGRARTHTSSRPRHSSAA